MVHSDLNVVPAERLAVFVSLNSAGNGYEIRRDLFRAFLDLFYPYRVPQPATVATASRDTARVAGWYETSRRHQTVLGFKRTLFQFHVDARPDGTIAIPVWGAPDTRKTWREIGPLTYQEVRGQARLSFVADADGAIRHFVSDDDAPIQTFQRVAWSRSKPVVTAGRWIAIGGLALVLAGSTAIAILQRRNPLAKGRWWVASRLGAGAILGALIAWPILTEAMARDLAWRMSGDANPWLLACYMLSVITTLGTAVIAWRLVAAWRDTSWFVRVLDCAAFGAALYWIWFALAFGALTFDLSY